MDEMMKDLIRQLKEATGNPEAQSRAEKLEKVLEESSAALERDLAEIRKGQEEAVAQSGHYSGFALEQVRKSGDFEDTLAEEFERGNRVLERMLEG